MPRRIESHRIKGPAGALEALLEAPETDSPAGMALVCHPHPLYGGTMHNKVVFRLARGLRRAGNVVLRFNFRGVGLSQGEHAYLVGEIEDARAAVAWLGARYNGLPLTLAGFSFGARVVSRLGCQGVAPARLILAGFPTGMGDASYLESCPTPKVFLQSTNDEFAPRHVLEALFKRLPPPKQLVWIPAADHFFAGALEALENEALQAAS